MLLRQSGSTRLGNSKVISQKKSELHAARRREQNRAGVAKHQQGKHNKHQQAYPLFPHRHRQQHPTSKERRCVIHHDHSERKRRLFAKENGDFSCKFCHMSSSIRPTAVLRLTTASSALTHQNVTTHSTYGWQTPPTRPSSNCTGSKDVG